MCVCVWEGGIVWLLLFLKKGVRANAVTSEKLQS